MAVAKAEILDAISNMTVLELSQLIKDMEDKFGVSAAAAAVAVAGPAAGGAAAAAAEEQTEFTVMLTASGDEQGQRHQGRACSHGPRPEGSQGPGRRRAEAVKEGISKADAEASRSRLAKPAARLKSSKSSLTGTAGGRPPAFRLYARESDQKLRSQARERLSSVPGRRASASVELIALCSVLRSVLTLTGVDHDLFLYREETHPQELRQARERAAGAVPARDAARVLCGVPAGRTSRRKRARTKACRPRSSRSSRSRATRATRGSSS